MKGVSLLLTAIVSPVYLAALLLTEVQAGQPVSIDIAPEFSLYTIKGGIGASMHAMEGGPGNCGGGSACGANPAPDDTAGWNSLYRHASWLGLDFCRIEFEQRMYEPQVDVFTFDNPEMQALYRWLDWCQANGVDVFFQQMWTRVSWTASDSVKAAGLARFVDHIVHTKKYTCVKWLSINNEPAMWWDWEKPLQRGFEAVRRALDKRGISLPLSGPDDFRWQYADSTLDAIDPFVGAYDMHKYGITSFSRNPSTEISWINRAHSREKPFFMSEVGSIIGGQSPGNYDVCIPVIKTIIGLFAVSIDGVNKWSFSNRGDMDGQWQLVDTWSIPERKLLSSFTPHPNAYYLYGLLSRFTAKHSMIVPVIVNDSKIGTGSPIVACAMRSPAGKLTCMVVNSSDSTAFLSPVFHGLSSTHSLYRYRIERAAHLDKTDVTVAPTRTLAIAPLNARFTDTLPPKSLTIYSSYNIRHEQPGIMSEAAQAGSVPVNLAFRKQATASASYSDAYGPTFVNDGCAGTRWAAKSDTDWISVDMRAITDISGIAIMWEDNFALSYRVLSSLDGNTWSAVATVDNGDGGFDLFDNLSVKARHVRVKLLKRSTRFAPSMYELGVFSKGTTDVRVGSMKNRANVPLDSPLRINTHGAILNTANTSARFRITTLQGRSVFDGHLAPRERAFVGTGSGLRVIEAIAGQGTEPGRIFRGLRILTGKCPANN